MKISDFDIYFLEKAFKILALISLFFLTIEGLSPYIEMFISGGRILSVIRPRVLFFISFLLLIFIRFFKKDESIVLKGKKILIPWLLFLFFYFVSFFIF